MGKDIRHNARLARRAAAYAGGVVAAAVALAILAALLPFARGLALSKVIDAVEARVPGSLTVSERSWRFPLTLELGGVLWVHEVAERDSASAGAHGTEAGTHGAEAGAHGAEAGTHGTEAGAPDAGPGADSSAAVTPGVAAAAGPGPARPETLVVARRIEISISPLALLRRDVSVNRLVVDDLSADLPAIEALLPAGGHEAPAERPSGGGRKFPREGSVGGLPSVGASEVRVTGQSIVISAGVKLDAIDLSGSFDFRHGRRPLARLDALTLRATAPGEVLQAPRIDRADLSIDVAEGRLQGMAAGALSPELPFYLSVVSDARDSFTMKLGAEEGDRPFDRTGLELAGTLTRRDGRVSGVTYEAELLTPGTRELSTIPALSQRLKGYPDLEGIPAELHGSVTFEPSLEVECRVEMRSNSWLEGGAARLAYGEGALSLDALSLELPDLALRASGAIAPDSIRASARLDADGARWLAVLAPDVTPPDSLTLHLQAEASGTRAAPLIQASLDAAARKGGFTLEELSVTAQTPSPEPGAAQPPMRATLYARALGTELATTVELTPPAGSSKSVSAEITPVVVRDSSQGPSIERERMLDLSRSAAGALGRCAVELTPESRRLAMENLRLTGGMGELRADGKLDPGGAGSFALNWTWPDPPSILLARAGVAPDLADSLRARWPAERPPRLAVRGTLDGAGGRPAVAATGEIRLPGPAELSPLLPAGAHLDDLGPIEGDLTFGARRGGGAKSAQEGAAATAGEGASFEARLDLGRTAWIDKAVVSLRGAGSALTIDSARVSFEGLSFDLAGTVDGGYFDLLSNLDLADARIARRLRPSLPEDFRAKLSARAAFKGRPSSPRVEASFAGGAAGHDYSLPRLEGVASWKESGLDAEIRAPNGLIVGPLQLDSLSASYAVEDTSGAVLPGAFALSAGGERLEISHTGVLRRLGGAESGRGAAAAGESAPAGVAPGERETGARRDRAAGGAGTGAARGTEEGEAGWLVETESFAVALEGNDLRSTGPFEISLLPLGTGVSIKGLSLEGTLGTLTAEGYASRTGSDLSLEANLTLPEDPPFIEVSEGLWPRSLEISLTATESGDLRAALEAQGLALGDRRDLVARLSAAGAQATGAQATPQGMDVAMVVSAGGDTVLEADGRLPLSISLYTPGVSFGDGPVSVTATARALPIPLGAGAETMIAPSDRTAALDCGAKLTGTSKEPRARIDGVVAFPDWPKLYRYRISFAARTGTASGEPQGGGDRSAGTRAAEAEGGTVESPTGVMPELEGAGLAAAFTLEREGRVNASGTLRLPMTWALLPLELKTDEAREMELRVQADQVDLASFDNLLPPKYGLKGKCSFNVTATGSPANPELGGKLTASEAGVVIDGGTRVIAGADVDLAGTRLNPSLAGKIEIQNGVIVIPERSKTLLPAQGRAALWELESARRGGGLDFASLAQSGAPARKRGELQTVPEPPRTKLELDVAVEIPSALWVRGRGLDVGLAGKLRLVQRGDLPTITGELEAVQGRFVFLGQTFAVERGRAVFYGGDEINPSLDILLTTTVEATQIQITLGGSVNDPKLQLSSVPELPEGDIMSLLVFGRTMDQLDNDQMALLGSRAADIATAFGTAQLEAKLARQLGVDVLRINTESEQAGGSSVVIGKYISPRVLLKYEQALGDRARFFVNLEYMLTQHFRLETLIGHESQSAVELNWTKEH